MKKLMAEQVDQISSLMIRKAVELARSHKLSVGDFYDYRINTADRVRLLTKHVQHLTYHPCDWHPDSPFRAHSVFCLAIAQDGTGELTTHEPGDCHHLRYENSW